MKHLLIYERPVQLNRVAHRNHRLLASAPDYSVASGLNSLPLAVTEFAHAGRDFPIVFAGNSADAVVPAALVGLRAGENLLVDGNGAWAGERYVPAFLRRYPFVLAEREPGSEDFTVCLDAAYPGLREGGEEGVALFDEDGKDGALLTNALQFLQQYQLHLARTRQFTAAVVRHGLLVERQISITAASGEQFALNGFHVVDEQKLRELKGKALQELAQSGDLGWIYAHLVSLGNVERLGRLLDQRLAATAA